MQISETDFWYRILINFFISLIIFIFIFFLNIVIKRNHWFKQWLKNKKYIYIYNLLISILISSSILLSISNIFYKECYFLIANIFIYSLILSPMVGYISVSFIILIFLSMHFGYNLDWNIFFNALLLLLLITIFNFISSLFSKSNIVILIYCLLISTLMNFNILFKNNSITNNLSLFIINLSIFVYLILLNAIIKPFNVFITNIVNLNEKSYKKNNFIIYKKFPIFFNHFMQEHNLEYGYLFVFKFKDNNKLYENISASRINEIKINLLSKLQTLLSNDVALYFLTKNDNYAFLVKTNNINTIGLKESIKGNNLANRLNCDPLQYFEQKIKNLPAKIFIDDKCFDLGMNFNVGIYGIQHNNINDLITLCEDSQHVHFGNNLINLCIDNFYQNKNYEQIKNNILIKHNFFKYDDISIKYLLIKINEKEYLLPKPLLLEKLIFNWKDFLFYYGQEPIIFDAIISHVTALSLKQIPNDLKNPIIIYYSQNSLMNENFDINLLVNKIKFKYNIDDFVFNIIMNSNNVNEFFINKLLLLKKMGIKCYLNISLIDKVKIKYLMSNMKIFKMIPTHLDLLFDDNQLLPNYLLQ